MIFDPVYFIYVGPAILLSLYASFKVKSTFNKYSKFATKSGMTGAQAAAEVMRAGGVTNVRIERIDGYLSDHYDPAAKVLRLSPEVYDLTSISAVGVGAHEAGHAIQDKVSYPMLMARSKLVPVVKIGSMLSWPLLIGGMFLQMTGLIYAGIAMFAAVVLFQLVTLPVEINASNRAKDMLFNTGVIAANERKPVAAVLNAAALTYVAALVMAVLQLLYFLMRAGLLGGGDD